jgi:multidrug efflux system membrane fusion protein
MDSRQPVIESATGQRRSPSGRNRVLTGAVLLLFVAGGCWMVQRRLSASAKANGPVAVDAVLVKTAQATRQDIPFFVEGLGRVRPPNTVLVRAQVDGQIAEIAFKEGQEVHTGDLLFRIDPRAYQAAVEQDAAKRAQDVAQRDSARKISAGNAALLAKGAIDQQSFDVQQAEVMRLEAVVQADEAALAEAQLQLERTRITSPIDGRAGLRLVDRGNLVHANDAAGLVVINQVQPIAVIVTLPERQLRQINVSPQADGTVPPLAVTAFDRDNQEVLDTGRLAAIDNQIEEASGTIRCKALFPNERLALWPGQFVNVRLLTETRKAALTVPASGVQQGADGYFTYVVRSDLTVELRPLKVAQVENGIAVVDEGLADGETVVIDGQYSLRPGALVRLTSSAPKA